MTSKDLTTKELVIVGFARQGYSPKSIALKLGLGTSYVRRILNKPKIIAYRYECSMKQ